MNLSILAATSPLPTAGLTTLVHGRCDTDFIGCLVHPIHDPIDHLPEVSPRVAPRDGRAHRHLNPDRKGKRAFFATGHALGARSQSAAPHPTVTRTSTRPGGSAI